MQSFLPAFWGTFRAILDIFAVVVVAGILVRKRVVTQSHVTGLTTVTVNVFLPALIFANLVKTFNPEALSFWWALPLAAVLMAAFGLGLAWVVFRRDLPGSKDLLPLVGLQNAGYLVLPLGLRLFPDQFDTFALYTFLFIMGLNPVLWSVGPMLASGRHASGRGWKGLLTPPLVASVLGILCVATRLDRFIPSMVLNASTLLGQAAVPVATFALGAILGGTPCCLQSYGRDALRVAVLKLVVMPGLMIVGLRAAGALAPTGLLAQFLVIEAATAPATGIVLQVRAYGGDERKIGSVMIVAYALCAVTLPLALVVWRMVSPS